MTLSTEFDNQEFAPDINRKIKSLHSIRRQEQPNETTFRKWWRKGLIEADKIESGEIDLNKGEVVDWYRALTAKQIESADDIVAIARITGRDMKKGLKEYGHILRDELTINIPNDWEKARQTMMESWNIAAETQIK